MTYTPAQSRRLDAWIAENIMLYKFRVAPGETLCQPPPYNFGVIPLKDLPKFTTDLLAAFEVVEKITKDDARKVTITYGCFAGRGDTADVCFSMSAKCKSQIGEAVAATVPLAIALAAIRAKGGDVELIAGGPA